MVPGPVLAAVVDVHRRQVHGSDAGVEPVRLRHFGLGFLRPVEREPPQQLFVREDNKTSRQKAQKKLPGCLPIANPRALLSVRAARQM